eukprot:TRINITY_DN21591_c0_g1_i1.p1 TRINITY_DN21591_c0_g1~~TRINITY_DN21591_c0_g1_i1.p1  ORF type:complete len:627 (+),score=105.50 TRINITY_DN21591_c0_g1_i1:71-1882(+)
MTIQLPSSWKVIAFTFNITVGLVLSQVMGTYMEPTAFHSIIEVVHILTMWALSYIMINVGYEFTVDKNGLIFYVWDYLIAMTAAGFPWLFVALWFLFLFDNMAADAAFLIARFAAPTSAGILFSMLEAAGLRETWVFSKARILAIFDDLDTILLMIPLKILMIGFKWELMVMVGIMVFLLAIAWIWLHALRLPYSWAWTLFYGGVVAAICRVVYVVTHDYIPMEPLHIEVLLPAFVVGCLIDTPCAREELEIQKQATLMRLNSSASLASKDSKKSATTAWGEVSGTKGDHAKLCDSPLRVTGKAIIDSCKDGDVVVEELKNDTCEGEIALPLGIAKIEDDVEAQTNDLKPTNGYVEAQANDLKTTNVCDDIVKPMNGCSAKVAPEVETGSGVRQSSKHSQYSTGSQAASNGSQRSEGRLSRHGLQKDTPHESDLDHTVSTVVSMVFMVLVGLSMPPLFGPNAGGGGSGASASSASSSVLPASSSSSSAAGVATDDAMGAGMIIMHVVVVSILMTLGKMFPVFCYRDEASWKGRLALCLGMCPRGEVGASIIVISLELGVSGPAIVVSMCALVINLVCSGFFIGMVKCLLRSEKSTPSTIDLLH